MMISNTLPTRAWLPLFAAACLLSACGDRSDNRNAAQRDGDTSAQVDEREAETIEITANDQMKFSLTEFTVPAGSEVTIVLRNVGQLPKNAMGHNLVILSKGSDPDAYANASMAYPENEYLDPDMEDRVIAATRLLGPGEEATLSFTVPSEPGDYPFLCSFPGHASAGMKGVMRVQ